MIKWEDVAASDEFLKLDNSQRRKAMNVWAKQNLLTAPEFTSLGEEQQSKVIKSLESMAGLKPTGFYPGVAPETKGLNIPNVLKYTEDAVFGTPKVAGERNREDIKSVEDEPEATWGEVLKSVVPSGVNQTARGVGGVAQAIGENLNIKSVADWGKDVYQGAGIEQEKITPNIKSGFKGAVYGAGTSVVQNLMTLPLSIATGSPIPSLAVMGVTAAGQGYGEGREAGLTPKESAVYGAKVGASEGVSELMPMATFLKPGISLGKRIIKSTIEEVFGENANLVYQEIERKKTLNPNMTWGEFLSTLPQKIKDVTYQTMLASPVLGGTSHALVSEQKGPKPIYEQSKYKPTTDLSVEDRKTRGLIVDETPLRIRQPNKEEVPGVTDAERIDLQRQQQEYPRIEEQILANTEAAKPAISRGLNIETRDEAKEELITPPEGFVPIEQAWDSTPRKDLTEWQKASKFVASLKDQEEKDDVTADYAELSLSRSLELAVQAKQKLADIGITNAEETNAIIESFLVKSSFETGKESDLDKTLTQILDESVSEYAQGVLSKQEEAAGNVRGVGDKKETVVVPEASVTEKDTGVEKQGVIVERRKDTTTRERINKMTPEEIEKELYTSHLTGLKNKRAYEESEKKKHQVSIDVDSLKYVNDEYGHEAGDALLKNAAKALSDAGLESYHVSGDEFIVQGDDSAQVLAALKDARSKMKESEVVTKDGKKLSGFDFTFGTGETLSDADAKLTKNKHLREKTGERSGRGVRPVGIKEVLTEKPKIELTTRKAREERITEEEKQKTKFHISKQVELGKHDRYEEVDGEKIALPNFEEFDFFGRKINEGTEDEQYVVSEVSTGMHIAMDDTKNAAVAKALSILSKQGVDNTRSAINSHVKEYGISPSGERIAKEKAERENKGQLGFIKQIKDVYVGKTEDVEPQSKPEEKVEVETEREGTPVKNEESKGKFANIVNKPIEELTDEDMELITGKHSEIMYERNKALSEYDRDPRFMADRQTKDGFKYIEFDPRLVREYVKTGKLSEKGQEIDAIANALVVSGGILKENSYKTAGHIYHAITTGMYNDTLHPDNKTSRKIFTELTGVKLPPSVSKTKALFTGKPFKSNLGKAESVPEPQKPQQEEPAKTEVEKDEVKTETKTEVKSEEKHEELPQPNREEVKHDDRERPSRTVETSPAEKLEGVVPETPTDAQPEHVSTPEKGREAHTASKSDSGEGVEAARPDKSRVDEERKDEGTGRGDGELAGRFSGGSADVGGYVETENREDEFKPVEAPELLELVREINEGKFPIVARKLRAMGGLARGYFRHTDAKGEKKGSAEILLQADIFANPKEAVKVLAHEVGHLIDWLPNQTLGRGNILGHLASLKKHLAHTIESLPGIKKKHIMRELVVLANKWKPIVRAQGAAYVAYRKRPAELYADMISVLFNNPSIVKELAPMAYDIFVKSLGKKTKVRDAYNAIQQRIKDGKDAVLEARQSRTLEGYGKAEKAFAEPVREMEQETFAQKYERFVEGFKRELVDRHSPLYSSIADPLTRQRVRNAIEDFLYYMSEGEAYFKEVEDKVLSELSKSDITEQQVGEYMERQRVVNERTKIANPGAHDVKTSQDALELLKSQMGDDNYAKMEELVGRFWEVRKTYVVDSMKKSGMYSSELIEKVEANEKYATFLVSDYITPEIEKGYGVGATFQIFKQFGTFKEIANPFTATIMKDLSLIRSVVYNNAVKTSVKALRDFGAEGVEFKPADVEIRRVAGGKVLRVPKPLPDGAALKLLTYMEGGKVVGWYVPKDIAVAFETNPIEANIVTRFLSMLNKPFKEIFTRKNPGFWLFNLTKDIFSAVKILPKASLHEFVPMMLGSVADAWHGMRGYDELTQDLLRGKGLIATINRDGRSEDTQLQRLRRMYGGAKQEYGGVLYRAIRGFLDYLNLGGELSERVTKIAAFKYLNKHFPEMSHEDKMHLVRWVGSPAFLVKGELTPMVNNLLLFFNPVVQGTRIHIDAAKNRPLEYAWKTTKYNIMPKAVMMGATYGLIDALLRNVFRMRDDDDRVKKMFDRISGYDITNYITIPFGWSSNKFVQKLMYLRVPQDEVGRIVSGLLVKAGDLVYNAVTDKDNPAKLSDLTSLLDFGVGQIPTFSPPLTAIANVGSFLSGNNPYDAFTGKYAVPENVFGAHDDRTLKYFGKYLANKLGVGVVHRFDAFDIGQVKTYAENIFEAPIASNMIGRFVRVSDTGVREKLRKPMEQVSIDEYRNRLNVNEAVLNIVNKVPKSEWTQRQKDSLVKYVSTHSGKEVYNKLLSFMSKRSADVLTTTLMSARTKDQQLAVIGEAGKLGLLNK